MNRERSTFISIQHHLKTHGFSIRGGADGSGGGWAGASSGTVSTSPRRHGRTADLNAERVSGNRFANYLAHVAFKPSMVTIRNPERSRSGSKSRMPSMPSGEEARDVSKCRRIAAHADVRRSVRSSRPCRKPSRAALRAPCFVIVEDQCVQLRSAAPRPAGEDDTGCTECVGN